MSETSPTLVSGTNELVERVLRGNWRTGSRGEIDYAYSSPSPHRYPWQWYLSLIHI